MGLVLFNDGALRHVREAYLGDMKAPYLLDEPIHDFDAILIGEHILPPDGTYLPQVQT